MIDPTGGLQQSGDGTFSILLDTNPGLATSSSGLTAVVAAPVKLDANGIGLNIGEGLQLSGSDLAADINGLAAESDIDGTSDYVAVYDASAGALRKTLLNTTNVPEGTDQGAWYNQINPADAQTLSKQDDRNDIGAISDSNPMGFYETKLSDKELHHCLIGDSQRDEQGSFRVNRETGLLQIFRSNEWRNILDGVTISEEEETDNELVHDPQDSIYTIVMHTGDSIEKSTSGLPVIQGYRSSIGESQPKQVLSGGSF